MITEDPAWVAARASMVKEQLMARDISDARVLAAMGAVPRHIFVDQDQWEAAYQDGPLPIGYNQTISQPYIVAFMTQALRLPADKQATILEVGTGSGYQAAVLSQLVSKVYSVERIKPLAERARWCLTRLGIDNVEIKVTDGGYGWPEYGPYDGIITTAAAPEMPAPLLVQLKEGARLIAPIGPKRRQQLIEVRRQDHKLYTRKLIPVAFVPLIGEHGWEANEEEE